MRVSTIDIRNIKGVQDFRILRGLRNLLALPLALLLISYAGYSKDLKSRRNPVSSDSIIKVALLQIRAVGADMEANLKKGDEYCRKAKAMGADIVLLPEMWSIGYSKFYLPGTDSLQRNGLLSLELWNAKAIDSGSDFINHFQHLAADLNMAIVINYLEKWNGPPRNSSSLIDSKGKIAMTYAKVHTCDFTKMEANCTPGDDFYVCELPVRKNKVKIGIMICYDREFPESARILMLKGAELILTPNASTLDKKAISQFQTRALENAVGVAMTNYPKPFQNGHSCAFNSRGDKLLIAGEHEGIFIVPFNIIKIREHRMKTINGNAFRRPDKYHLLASPSVDSVFIRENGLGVKFIREKR